MKCLSSSEIRQMFLDFFKEKGHVVEPSASLIPVNDPTLLWINSGVATLKKYFDGRVVPENPRIVNAQKCIRTPDIEEVGLTARHHTFFEMLGNFSIGDYFRKEAIAWGWELLTSPKWFGLAPDKLYVTVYPEDRGSYDEWIRLGVDARHIILLEGNFWEIGEGPCGPCTEIFYDRGVKYDPDGIGIRLLEEDLENDRYLEIWNIVLSQFNSKDELERKDYPELPNKNIDTGAGLERLTAVMQNADTNFDTDLFLPMIRATERVSGQSYRSGQATVDTAFKVIADHIRTISFAIADGALPANEGRGYILRRLLRRSVRFAKKLGIERPFMYELVPVVADVMESYYPNVKAAVPFIQTVVKTEEERFHETLNDGLAILAEIVQVEKAAGRSVIPGTEVFKLYDTFGFPVELTEEYAADEMMTVDREGFEAEMEVQRTRARSARQDVASMQVQGGVLGDLKAESLFMGYQELTLEAKIVYLLKDGQLVEEAEVGEQVQLILERTPFYAESGGQVSDLGTIAGEIVTDVQKAPNGQPMHSLTLTHASLKTGAKVLAKVDATHRLAVTKNHTATHLLHQALKDVLGTHVNQAGSLVTAERLRFDFSHFGAVTAEQIERIEQVVNEKIWASLNLEISNREIEDAKAMGAMALFGEKYGDVVRVVQVGDYSTELCGGCHVTNSASIGLFKILSEAGIGAGTRRIEAVTGQGAYELMSNQIQTLKAAAVLVKVNPKELPVKLEQLLGEWKAVQKENESLVGKLANIEAKSLADRIKEVNGVSLLAEKVTVQDMATLRNMTDELKMKLPSAIIVLGSVFSGKVNLIAVVSKDLVEQGYHAGKMIKEIATICEGTGGGRPDMAQAGGKNPSKLFDALAAVPSIISKK